MDDNQKLDSNEYYLVDRCNKGPQIDDDASFNDYFNWIDEDGNGTVSWREFKASWDKICPGCDYSTLKDMFKFADSDKNGGVTYNEGFAEHEAQDTFNRKFNKVDTNWD